ncbi:MAG: HesA/MoeB/ThiF family protein [Burkholderiales bacterium]|nr:HesA/MoeB/ThiF family protein [Burkholderiales bacterium]
MNKYHRYISQLDIFGNDGQNNINQAKVLCIGAGGLGSIVATYLVAGGLINLDIIDGDIVELSNLTRQVMYNEKTVGTSKVTELKNKLIQLHSNSNINIYNKFLDKTSQDIFKNNYNLVLDCSDNFATRYLISDLCCEYNTPLISASVDGFYGQVLLLLNSICYRCVFPNINNPLTNCNIGNVVGTAVGIIATYQANEALKFITGLSTTNRLINLDTLNNSISTYQLNQDINCINFHHQNTNTQPQIQLIPLNTVLELAQTNQIYLIDLSQFSYNTDIFNIESRIEYLIKHNFNKLPITIICNYGYKAQLIATKLSTKLGITISYAHKI